MQLEHEIRRRPIGVNVPRGERAVSVAAGALAGVLGLRIRGVPGILLGAAGAYLAARGLSGRCPVYRTITLGQGIEVHRSITILRARKDVYATWRRLSELPRFLQHVRRIEVLDDVQSRWTVEEGPLTLSWDAKIVEDVPGRRIAWRSLPGSQVHHEGVVELRDAPAGRGTEVLVSLRYRPPGGALVAAPLRALLRSYTRHQLGAELMRLRQLLETGELATGMSHVEPARELGAAVGEA